MHIALTTLRCQLVTRDDVMQSKRESVSWKFFPCYFVYLTNELDIPPSLSMYICNITMITWTLRRTFKSVCRHEHGSRSAYTLAFKTDIHTIKCIQSNIQLHFAQKWAYQISIKYCLAYFSNFKTYGGT